MRRRRAEVAALLTVFSLAAAGPVSAAGPYEPFSEGDPRERSTQAIDRLNDQLIPGGVAPVDPALLEDEGVVVHRKKRGAKIVPAPVAAAMPGAGPGPEVAAQKTPPSGDGLFGRAGLSQPADQPTPDVAWLVALAAALALAAAGVEVRRMRLRGSL